MLHQPFYRATANWTASDRKGRPLTRSATAISHTSAEDAKRRAQAEARRWVEEAISGDDALESYGYGERFRVEPVVRRIGIPGTPGSAAISINGYGSEVLNTERLMFVDVDLPPPRNTSLWGRLFGAHKETDVHMDRAIDRLTDLLSREPDSRVRVYRTAAGLRYLFVNRPFDATAEETAQMMRGLEADEKFVVLCRVQKCFRARLTPKPWRCGIVAARPKFEGTSDQPGPEYQAWRTFYQEAASAYATCRFVEEFGHGATDPALRELVDLHDSMTKSDSGAPLA